MNSRKIKYLTACAAALFSAAGIGAIVLLQNRIAVARAENASLRANQTEMQRLQTENADLDQLRSVNEQVVQLKLANKDLPRLRNQIRQLRNQAAEAAKLQAENEQLAAGQNKTAEVPEGFIPKASLRFMGYGTPEATLQTFFHAQCQGDAQGASQCMVTGGNIRPSNGERENNRLRTEMESFPGFAVVSKSEISPDRVAIKIQANVGGEMATLKLVKINNDWKLTQY